jgi:hypothetical protein
LMQRERVSGAEQRGEGREPRAHVDLVEETGAEVASSSGGEATIVEKALEIGASHGMVLPERRESASRVGEGSKSDEHRWIDGSEARKTPAV